MNKLHEARLLAAVLIVVLFSGCAGYKAVAIPKLQPEFAANAQKQNDVVVAVRVFTVDDCRRYFDYDIIGGGYQPIQIGVDNQSKEYWLLSKNGISQPSVPPEEVATACHRSTVGRATAYGVGALFLWPLAIPAVVDGVKSSNANTRMDSDFAAKGLQDSVIQPFNTVNGIIFVPVAECRPDLTINLINKETRDKLTFIFNNIK
jgi:hypothetical protein